MKKAKKKGALGLGLMCTGILAAAGATAVAILKKKKREEVYHEAELKAMRELDDLMAEHESEDCETCSMDEEPVEVPAAVQDASDETEEAEDEPIQDVADEDDDAPEA